ncbi:MAG: phospho-N-acetylmuramoyl-pentapeptide-transferase [[Clostridium] leptum]
MGLVDLGWAYWLIAAVLIVGVVNAVNFTDGIDGLNGSVTFFFAVFCMVISSYLSMFGLSIMAAAVAGGCLGFLLWNFNPAKVFMGDTGSLFLGGAVCALTFGMDLPILLIPLGIIYWMEIGSVMLQVTYFKLTHGKRLFKMSPIHHHFELCGWNEVKICVVFSCITMIGGIASMLLVFFGV